MDFTSQKNISAYNIRFRDKIILKKLLNRFGFIFFTILSMMPIENIRFIGKIYKKYNNNI